MWFMIFVGWKIYSGIFERLRQLGLKMTFFTKFNQKDRLKILILGSYHPDHLEFLKELKEKSKNSGYSDTYLGKDYIEIPEEFDGSKLSYIYTEIEKLMKISDFNFFILMDAYSFFFFLLL